MRRTQKSPFTSLVTDDVIAYYDGDEPPLQNNDFIMKFHDSIIIITSVESVYLI